MPLSFRSAARLAVAAAAVGAALSAPRAARAQWRGEYYMLTVHPEANRHPDVEQGVDGRIVLGLVESALSANRLPVATACAQLRAGDGCGLGNSPINDVDAAGRIQWWNAAGAAVQRDDVGGSSNVRYDRAISFPSAFFPGGAYDNYWFMRAVRWSATAANSGTFTMGLSADDDAWLFRNGELVLDNGGVKAMGLYSTAAVTVNRGDRFDLFFADRNRVESGVVLDQGGMVTTTPEPGSVALVGAGLAAVAAAARRRRRARAGA